MIDSVKTNSYQESLHNTTKYGEVSNYKHALAFLFGNLHVLMDDVLTCINEMMFLQFITHVIYNPCYYE